MFARLNLTCVFSFIIYAAAVVVVVNANTNNDHGRITLICCSDDTGIIVCKNHTQHELSITHTSQLCTNQSVVAIVNDISQLNLTQNTSLWCLSKKDSSFLLFACDQNVNKQHDNSFKLGIRNKCCPFGHVYLSGLQQCVRQTFDIDLVQQYAWPMVVINADLNCQPSEILVEYNDVQRQQLDFVQDALLFNNKRYSLSAYCAEEIVDTTRFLLRVCEQQSICRRIPCLRRCCGIGQRYDNSNGRMQCVPDDAQAEFVSFSSIEYAASFIKPKAIGIINGQNCLKYYLEPEDAGTINPVNGNLMFENPTISYHRDSYCVERRGNATWIEDKLDTFLCFEEAAKDNDVVRFRLYSAGLLISCGFYVATLVVYLTLEKLRNLPGKILICLVINLLAAYLSIALGQLTPAANDTICFVSAFFIYFCLMAAFTWMNILSFDIWRTFGTTKNRNFLKVMENRQILLYSLYGWGLPTILTTITIILTKTELIEEYLRPQFGQGKCWFSYESSPLPSLLFFSGPIGLMFLMNVVLFTLTLRYCNKVKAEINRMQNTNMHKPDINRRFFMDKARFVMNTKLFIVMGITWLLELTSIIFYDHEKTMMWIISDSFNVLLGVFIFFIYVCKKRVWQLIRAKFGYTQENASNMTCITPLSRSSMPSFKQHSIQLTKI